MKYNEQVLQGLLDLDWIDMLSQENGFGSFQRPTIQALTGINMKGYVNMVQHNADMPGLVLFTRPRLNLSYDNLGARRMLTPLMTDDPATYQRYIRDVLDPVGARRRPKNHHSLFFDEKSAFIPIMSNTLISLPGWPDRAVGTYTTEPGNWQQEQSQYDGTDEVLNSFDLTANFRNISGNMLLSMLGSWLTYGNGVYEGDIFPWPDAVVENEMDYWTRIWRLVLDPTRKYVQQIGSTFAFPYSLPTGSIYNYEADALRGSDYHQFSVGFKCNIFEERDPILIPEFNQTVAMFNPDMGDEYRAARLQKINDADINYVNNACYPHIAEDGELEWWCDRDVYQRLVHGGKK